MTFSKRPPRDLNSFLGRKWLEGLGTATGSLSALGLEDFVMMTASTEAPNSRRLVGSARISVTDGGAGSTVALDLATVGTAGTYTKVTTDVYGRVTSGTSVTLTDFSGVANKGVLFGNGSGSISQDTSNFIYDDSTNRLSVGLAADYTSKLSILVGGATEKGAVIRLAAAQTANAIEVQNSGGTGLACINESGWIGAGVTSSLIAPLHVKGSGVSTLFALQDTNGAGTASQMLWGWYDNLGVRQAYYFKNSLGSLTIANEQNAPIAFVVSGQNMMSFDIATEITAYKSIYPNSDNTYSLGSLSKYWSAICSRVGFFTAAASGTTPLVVSGNTAPSADLVTYKLGIFTTTIGGRTKDGFVYAGSTTNATGSVAHFDNNSNAVPILTCRDNGVDKFVVADGGEVSVFTGFADAVNVSVGSTTGTKFGTATTQKLAFFNSTPIVQPANSVSLETVLSNLGLRASGTTAPLSVGALTATQVDILAQGDLRLQDTTGGEYTAIQAAGTVTTYTITLPAAVGSTGQYLAATDNAGTLGWTTPATDKVKPLFDLYTDAGNSGTTETDLYSSTLAAGELANNGDKLVIWYGINLPSASGATVNIRMYFGGSAIFGTGALTKLAAGWMDIRVEIVRVSSTTIRYTAFFQNTGYGSVPLVGGAELAGLTLSNTNVIKITGQAGAGGANNDIVAKCGAIYKVVAA